MIPFFKERLKRYWVLIPNHKFYIHAATPHVLTQNSPAQHIYNPLPVTDQLRVTFLCSVLVCCSRSSDFQRPQGFYSKHHVSSPPPSSPFFPGGELTLLWMLSEWISSLVVSPAGALPDHRDTSIRLSNTPSTQKQEKCLSDVYSVATVEAEMTKHTTECV